jgi:tetratricopeptide (TPR) repeat protein
MAAAAALLQRAYDVVPPDAPERLDIAIRLSDALAWIDWTDESIRVLDEADRLVDHDDARTRARIVVVRRAMRLWGPEPEDAAQTLADARQAIATLEEAGDDESLAYAYVLAYHAASRLSSSEYEEQDLTRAIEHARVAGARALEGLATGWLCVDLRHGPLPVDEAKRRILEVLENPPTRYARASALGGLADLRAMQGAFDEARALVAENHAIIEELGLPQTEAADLIAVADVEFQAGDLAAAERILREAIDRLTVFGAHYERAHAAWRLARVLVRQGLDNEALPFVSQASVERGGEFVGVWRTVLEATIAARSRRPEAATLLQEADGQLGRFTETGMLVDVLLQTAEVSELLGRRDDAAARLRRAAALAERLGYVVALQDATARLAEVDALL